MANFESVEVYRGWVAGDGTRALRLEADFQALWSNQTPHLSVERFPDVARERLVKLGSDRPPRDLPGTDNALTPTPAEVYEPTRLTLPDWLTVRDYQREAVTSWLSHQGRGILKMATGTGKTKTAMIAATQLGNVLRQREQPLVLLIVAPLTHLVDQWITEVEGFGVRPIAVYESSQRWLPLVEEQLAAARMGQRPVVAMVATNASFSGEKFQSVLSRINLPLMIIGDEAHNLGSAAYQSSLPENATYRLALSATPERWFDDDGTDALIDYFGPIIFELGLGKAIEMGALTRYEYLPRLVELNDAETALYVDLSAQIATRIASGDNLKDADPNSPLGFLLRQRAGVLGHAEGKLAALRADLDARRDDWFQLIYCAEGRRPAEPGEEPGPKQVEEVMNLVGNQLHLSAHSYVSETPRPERKVLLRRFGAGDDLRALVAMRCLDEGVDIPDARTGYLLASSSNPRQFIQRRGRLLRLAPGKDRAVILDYLAVPPAGTSINFNVERALLVRELELVVADPALLETLRPDKLLPSTDVVPERFELGTLPYEMLAGVTAAIDLIAGLAPSGGSRRERLVAAYALIGDHELRLRRRIEEGLAGLGDHLTLHSRAADRTSTLFLTLRDRLPVDAYEFLAKRDVLVPAGTFYAYETFRALDLPVDAGLRIGLAAYNDDAEIDRLLEGLTDFFG